MGVFRSLQVHRVLGIDCGVRWAWKGFCVILGVLVFFCVLGEVVDDGC